MTHFALSIDFFTVLWYSCIKGKITVGENIMFDNIGSKIKSLAQIVCWLGIIVSAVSGLAIMISNEETVFVGLLIILLGSIGSWVGSFVLYGFG